MTNGTIRLAELVKGQHSISMFTGNLRWHDGVLEQEVGHTDYEDGSPVNRRTEWLAVPVVVGETVDKQEG